MNELFEQWAHEACTEQQAVSANGSNRKYLRMLSKHHQCIAAYNADVRENEAFFYYDQQFRQRGLRVPEIYAISADRTRYLQQDLGDNTLYSYLVSKRANGIDFDEDICQLYHQAIDDLIRFQTQCRDLDFSYAYPRADFDRQSIAWDLNYFKYFFLKLGHIKFDEQLLENDFNRLSDYLLDEDCSYFLYRDFQARNIMITSNKELYYIDFQGGRRGAAQYDIASLLYSAKSALPQEARDQLLNYYVDRFCSVMPQTHRERFIDKFYGYLLIRMMQTLGAYGYRGFFEKKDYFLRSIPLAVANLRYIIRNHPLDLDLPELNQVWNAIAYNDYFQPPDQRLNLRIFSFSYKKGIPIDKSGNGGGFVFDCRCLPNPGRYDEYKQLNGLDQPVITFFQTKPEVEEYLHHVIELVDQAITQYQALGYQNLMVNFGCTGGQHRSVYCAERLAQHVRQKYDIRIVLRHIEQQK